jgi:predicted ATP-dependent endonuclease of OLD family
MLLYDGRSYAFQWDLNISVVVPKAMEGQDIEFSFSKDENAVTTKAYVKNDLIVADIPNYLLKRTGFLNVYHILEDEKGNRTIWQGQLRILKKRKLMTLTIQLLQQLVQLWLTS